MCLYAYLSADAYGLQKRVMNPPEWSYKQL